MRYVLPLMLAACAAEAAPTARPVGMVWNQAASDCDEAGNAYLPAAPTALVQAMSCHEAGCSATAWGSVDDQWVATCGRGATVVEWTWIAPAR